MVKNSIHTTSAKRIAQILYERGWNRSELARRVGLSVQAVQQWAAGVTKPSRKNLTKLAEATGKPEHWYFMEPSEEQKSSDELDSADGITPLTQQHRKLLALFDQMPESEKKHMILLFEEKVREYDRLLITEIIELKNKNIANK